METTVNRLPGSRAEISITISPEESRPHLEAAAAEISKMKPIDGFRPGHAPYEAVVRAVGEMAVYEAALQRAVPKAYAQAIKEHGLAAYGEPGIEVKKLVPGEPIAVTAAVTLVPAVTDLADMESVRIRLEVREIKDSDVDKAIEELCRMRTKESAVDRPVQAGDKVVVDMDMKLDGVPVEGGQAKSHGIYLDEEYYVPGLKDRLVGAKIGEPLSFTLPFPKEHFQKALAGRDVEFAVTVRQVFLLEPPAADDDLAKSLGQESLAKLKGLIRENMEKDAAETARREAEGQAIERLVERSRFEDIPDLMVTQEVNRMVGELEHDVAHRGLELSQYLESIGKSLGQLKLDFAAQALKRVQTALLMKAIADGREVAATDAEAVAEQEKMINRYANDAEAQAKIRGEDFLDYIRANIRNRKVIELIGRTCIESK